MCGKVALVIQKHSVEVGLKRPVELLVRDVADVLLVRLLAGVVDRMSRPPRSVTAFFTSVSQNALSVMSPGRRTALRPSASISLATSCASGISSSREAQRDRRRLAREGDGGRAPDAGVGAGHEGLPPFQASVTSVAGFPMVGLRLHRTERPARLLRLPLERRLRVLGAGVLHLLGAGPGHLSSGDPK